MHSVCKRLTINTCADEHSCSSVQRGGGAGGSGRIITGESFLLHLPFPHATRKLQGIFWINKEGLFRLKIITCQNFSFFFHHLAVIYFRFWKMGCVHTCRILQLSRSKNEVFYISHD